MRDDYQLFLIFCDFFHNYAALSHDLKRRTSHLDLPHLRSPLSRLLHSCFMPPCSIPSLWVHDKTFFNTSIT